MDLNIIIMSAVIIAICLLPMFFLSRKQSQKKKQIKNILSTIAKTKSGELASHEMCGHVAIGMTNNDEAFVFYKKHEDGSESKSCVLLSEVKHCAIVRTSTSSGNIGKLVLNFEMVDKTKSDISIELFNASESFQLAGELQLVEKWKPIIENAITSQKMARQSLKSQKNNMAATAV